MQPTTKRANSFDQVLAEVFERARERCAFSVLDLARLAGVDPEVIVAIEAGTGSTQHICDVEKAAAPLGITPHRLLAIRPVGSGHEGSQWGSPQSLDTK